MASNKFKENVSWQSKVWKVIVPGNKCFFSNKKYITLDFIYLVYSCLGLWSLWYYYIYKLISIVVSL